MKAERYLIKGKAEKALWVRENLKDEETLIVASCECGNVFWDRKNAVYVDSIESADVIGMTDSANDEGLKNIVFYHNGTLEEAMNVLGYMVFDSYEDDSVNAYITANTDDEHVIVTLYDLHEDKGLVKKYNIWDKSKSELKDIFAFTDQLISDLKEDYDHIDIRKKVLDFSRLVTTITYRDIMGIVNDATREKYPRESTFTISGLEEGLLQPNDSCVWACEEEGCWDEHHVRHESDVEQHHCLVCGKPMKFKYWTDWMTDAEHEARYGKED